MGEEDNIPHFNMWAARSPRGRVLEQRGHITCKLLSMLVMSRGTGPIFVGSTTSLHTGHVLPDCIH